jgi:hypothetical protein
LLHHLLPGHEAEDDVVVEPLRQQQSCGFRQEQSARAAWQSADRPTCGHSDCGSAGVQPRRDLVEDLVGGALPLSRTADEGERTDLHTQGIGIECRQQPGSHCSRPVGMSPSWIKAW